MGSPVSSSDMGKSGFLEGIQFEKDLQFNKARERFIDSAKNNNSLAFYRLGLYNEFEIGGKQQLQGYDDDVAYYYQGKDLKHKPSDIRWQLAKSRKQSGLEIIKKISLIGKKQITTNSNLKN